jgi:hypothetical protein
MLCRFLLLDTAIADAGLFFLRQVKPFEAWGTALSRVTTLRMKNLSFAPIFSGICPMLWQKI